MPRRVSPLPVLARWIRAALIRMTTAAGSGHLTSSLSATDLVVALFFGGVFRADVRRPSLVGNDRFILSKGHAAPLLYATYAAAGAIPVHELETLRRFGSRLEGHPLPTFPWTEVPTGSLGQGLAAGVGLAIAARLQRLPYRTFVLLGDSELSEGSVWEAAALAAHRKLGNVIAIVDVNRLGQSRPTPYGWNLAVYAGRFRAFGWRTMMVDGHDLTALVRMYRRAVSGGRRPTVVLAKTVKGQGVSFLENRMSWHGRVLDRVGARRALTELGAVPHIARGRVLAPPRLHPTIGQTKPLPRPRFRTGSVIAPRAAIGDALVALGSRNPKLLVLDGEVANSTYTDRFERAFPRRFVECFIAEQTMAGVTAGLAARGLTPVAVTFAAFWLRAADQLRMNAYAGTHQVYVGTHAGVSIGPDGASQMGLSDLALFRSLAGSTVLYPADGTAAVRLTELAGRVSGLVYLRATRDPMPVFYPASTRFVPGGSHVLRRSPRDRATIVAAGVTLREALIAADQLGRRLPVRVIDCYSVKPIDAATLKRAARETGHLVVVEDHGPVGGLADEVRSALGPLAGTVTSLAVTKVPRSGRGQQLLKHQGIAAAAIVRTVRRLVRRSP